MDRRVGVDVRSGRWISVEWEGRRIARVEDAPPGDDAESPLLLSPGFLDVQINGLGGVNFGNPDLAVDDVRRAAGRLYACGATHFAPTLITDSIERMEASLVRLAQAAAEPDLSASILGFHLEGPYLSKEDGPRGAHPLDYCRTPDWDEFQRLQKASGGRVKIVTLAPELPGAIDFIRLATASGVRVAIGHTSASRDDILAAVDAGASLSTHLGNAAHDQIQRHRNYVFDQLGEDRLWASLIVDGWHLPPHVVQIFFRAKGLSRTILVSDAVQYAGLPAGVYDGGYRKFEVREDGFIGVVGEPRLAGSGLLLRQGVENLVRFTGVSLAEAVSTVTGNPARWLGLEDRLGALEVGREASLVVLRWNPGPGRLAVRETIVAGRSVYHA